MAVITFYFAGSGHGIDHDLNDDSLVEAYNNTRGTKAFFPGPGGTPNIYASGFDLFALKSRFGKDIQDPQSKALGSLIAYNTKIKEYGSKSKRSMGGKGWNRNVWYALNLIAAALLEGVAPLTLNVVGHSRRSITVIMLLNDMFYRQTGRNRPFKIASAKVKDTWKQKKGGFAQWYLRQIEAVWQRRMGANSAKGSRLARQGVVAMQTIEGHQAAIAGVNAWLYDPVAGKSEALTNRKQEFPTHPLIKRVRVLRMEQGGMAGGLSSGMPTFPGWDFLDGNVPRNLRIFENTERYVIPMPGSHGAGLSKNIKKGRPTTMPQWYIGTSYMVGLLRACGTSFAAGYPEQWNDESLILQGYDLLLDKYRNVMPGKGDVGRDRRNIHHHHTKGGYAGNAVNADHRFLQ